MPENSTRTIGLSDRLVKITARNSSRQRMKSLDRKDDCPKRKAAPRRKKLPCVQLRQLDIAPRSGGAITLEITDPEAA